MEDDSGNLWFSSNKGLTRFNIRSEKVTNYSVYDGVQGNEFNSGAYCRNPEGWMFFGGTNGWNMFHPDSIKESSFEPEIVFTDFQIMNKSIAPGEFSNYPTDLNNLDNLIINPDQQVFSFEFAPRVSSIEKRKILITNDPHESAEMACIGAYLWDTFESI